MSAEHRTLLDIARAAAHEAGEAILEIYRQDFAVWRKADDSPVTRADERAEAIIEQRLAATVPDIPVIAEEGCAAHGLPSAAPPPIMARPVPARGAIVVHSRSHGDGQRLAEYIATLPDAERRFSGSALKFCLLAAGEADLYPRFGPTAEWDTAAGQAILEAAGGGVTTLAGEPLRYGKPGFCNPDFIARGRS